MVVLNRTKAVRMQQIVEVLEQKFIEQKTRRVTTILDLFQEIRPGIRKAREREIAEIHVSNIEMR